ncbi:MAG: TauD/TfdA family dioxygenase [Pseudonocardiaceae bacterium]
MQGHLMGTFLEQASDPHVDLRRQVLASGAALREPAPTYLRARASNFPDEGGDELLAELHQRGFGVVWLDRPLSNDRFIALGILLGTAMPEIDTAVRPYVDSGVILNLIAEYDATRDVNLEPFATNFLTLHSEGSGRPVRRQPRYIVLMCCEPGLASAARTVLVSMAKVAGRLTLEQLRSLGQIRYRRNDEGPSIVRSVAERTVFSFRDFAQQPLQWVSTDAVGDPDEVNATIRGLLAAMYAPGVATGVVWSPGMVVVIDNTFYFHGRTAGQLSTSIRRRHLKRLRIVV